MSAYKIYSIQRVEVHNIYRKREGWGEGRSIYIYIIIIPSVNAYLGSSLRRFPDKLRNESDFELSNNPFGSLAKPLFFTDRFFSEWQFVSQPSGSVMFASPSITNCFNPLQDFHGIRSRCSQLVRVTFSSLSGSAGSSDTERACKASSVRFSIAST